MPRWMERRSPPGSRCSMRPRPLPPQGFTYVGLLAAIVITGILLAAAGRVWSLHEQREREVQLLFVGNQIRSAIARYYLVGRRYPLALQDLVQDDRTPATRRFLRKVYIDPMTGAADWTLIPAADGGFMGVASASKLVPIKQRGFDWTNQGFSDSDCYCKWQFIYDARLRPWQQTPRR